MDFFVVGVGLWGLIILSLILFIVGWWKRSWLSFFISGLLLLVPTIILATQRGWFTLFIVLPLVVFWVAMYTKKGAN